MKKTGPIAKLSSGLFLGGVFAMIIGFLLALMGLKNAAVLLVLIGFVLVIAGMLLTLFIISRQITPVTVGNKAQSRAETATEILFSLLYLIH